MATESSAVVRFIDVVQRQQHAMRETEIVRPAPFGGRARPRVPVLLAGAALVAGAAIAGGVLVVSERSGDARPAAPPPPPGDARPVAAPLAVESPANVEDATATTTPPVEAAAVPEPIVSVPPEILAETGFDIRVSPPAEISLDGAPLGTSPLRVRNVEPGLRVIEIQAPDGYFSRRVPVDLVGGEPHELDLRLDPIPGSASMAAEPAEDPAAEEPAAGQPAAPASSRRADPPRSRPRATRAAASPAGEPGTLMLGSKPPCDIIINGARTGLKTPQRSIELAPGKHRITLRNRELGLKQTFTVVIAPGETTRAIRDLTSKL